MLNNIRETISLYEPENKVGWFKVTLGGSNTGPEVPETGLGTAASGAVGGIGS